MMNACPSSLLKGVAPAIAAVLLAAAPKSAHGQSYPPAWNGTATYVSGDLVQYAGNTYRAITSVPANQNPGTAYDDWQLNTVLSNTTLMIGTGQTFPTLTAAWDYAIDARVADGVYLHFYLSSSKGNFSQTFSAAFLLDHASGPRMAILGDNTANDVISFGATNGLVIDTGHSFNTLSGFTLQSTGAGQYGIKATSDATITAIAGVTVTGFDICLSSTNSASVTVDSSSSLSNFSDQGFGGYAAFGGSIMFPQGITIVGPGKNGGNAALFASDGGIIDCPYSTISACNSGAYAVGGGIIDVSYSTLKDCYYAGSAIDGGLVSVYDCKINHCTSAGVLADEHGFINSEYAQFASNKLDIWAVAAGCVDAFQASYSSSQSSTSQDGSYINLYGG